jgi:hypothetical protein
MTGGITVLCDLNCCWCGDDVAPARWSLGYRVCLVCGEEQAKAARATWCIAPMHKSNYVLITDRRDLHGLNNKGGLVR